MMLRPGRAGANTAAEHIAVTKDALRQLPFARRGGRIGRKVLIRADGGGGTHEFLGWLVGQGLSYSVGFGLTQDIVDKINQIPDQGWTPAYDGDGKIRDGAWVTELTGMLQLKTWPAGMRVIVRAERPHPGAQLRFTDVDGNRLTAFVTNTTRGQLADLELRHRHRARCEDRIRSKGHRPAEPAAHRVHAESDLGRRRAVGDRAHQLAADARADGHRSPPLGAETAASAAVLRGRDHCSAITPHLPAVVRACTASAPVHHRPGPTARPPAGHLTPSTPTPTSTKKTHRNVESGTRPGDHRAL